LAAIARGHGLRLVEDAACAIGSELLWDGAWQRVGRPHSDAACFSFHPRKILTTGDGGMVVTTDPALDARVRSLRQHAIDRADQPAIEVGFNYRMTDLQAAVGRCQLERLPELVAARRRQAARYGDLLAPLVRRGVTLPIESAFARANFQSYCVRLPAGVDPDVVIARLAAGGVSARRGIMNAHAQAPYASGRFDLPESDAARAECLTLPLFPGMTESAQARVSATLGDALSASA
jgi:dTDP-4-amino-4,6-dideoxygalactose transaminase